MGQLEKYGLYVLCLVIFLILGVAIWGDDPAQAAKIGGNEPFALKGGTGEPPPPAERRGEENPDGGFEDISDILTPVELPEGPLQNGSGDDENRGAGPSTPTTEPVSEPPPVAAQRTCKVREFDTMEKIARRELGDKNRWPEIQALNPKINPKRMQIGTVLKLPGGASSSTKTNQKTWRWEPVRHGDNFTIIARKLFSDDRKVEEIKKLNPNVDPRKLRPGMSIKVPLLH